MDAETNQDIWEVEANGEVFQTNFAEMATWINEGSLLRIDRVRKGNLRWIEAGKVPSLIEFFNAKDAAAPPPPVVSTTTTEILGVATPQTQQFINSPASPQTPPAAAAAAPATAPDVCSMHPDFPAKYICDTCSNLFCKGCPSSYGGNVKICPFCGAMCRSFAEVEAKSQQTHSFQRATTEGFGFSDFSKAIAYPFKFKTSLILGAFMFMLFSIGQSSVGFGGVFMMFSALICFLLANTLTFGILANTVENFSQGKLDVNFMPTFDDFSLWDDVVHPFFLSIGTYIVSFGPAIALFLIAVFYLLGSAKTEMNGIQSDAARTVNPELPYAANSAKQSEVVKGLLNKQQQTQKERIAAMENREIQPDASEPPASAGGTTFASNSASNSAPNPPAYAGGSDKKSTTDPDEEFFNKTNKMIQDSRKAQLESAVGKTPETIAAEREALIKKLLGYGAVFLLVGGLCLLWGVFYFPAALAVAGYTRSFAATLNPLVGLDTIRQLGLDYVKILLMGLVLAIASGFVSGVLAMILQPFDLPGLGNVPARAIGSLFGFYLSVVFSCVIAFALYKKSDRLKLPR